MTVQLTKHFYDLIKKAMADDFVEYQVQTEAEAIKWAKERLDDIPPSVTIDDVEKARGTIAQTVLVSGESQMYRSAFAVLERLYVVAIAMQEQERKSANTGAIVEGLCPGSSPFKARAERASTSWASPETSEHILGSPPVVETAPDPEQDWLYLYDGRSQWIQIGSSDPTNISGGSREIHLGNVRIHTDGGKLVAVEIMGEPSDKDCEK